MSPGSWSFRSRSSGLMRNARARLLFPRKRGDAGEGYMQSRSERKRERESPSSLPASSDGAATPYKETHKLPRNLVFSDIKDFPITLPGAASLYLFISRGSASSSTLCSTPAERERDDRFSPMTIAARGPNSLVTLFFAKQLYTISPLFSAYRLCVYSLVRSSALNFLWPVFLGDALCMPYLFILFFFIQLGSAFI